MYFCTIGIFEHYMASALGLMMEMSLKYTWFNTSSIPGTKMYPALYLYLALWYTAGIPGECIGHYDGNVSDVYLALYL